MAEAGMTRWSLRAEQADVNRLARGFIISVALHLLLAGTYYTGKRLNWWDHLSSPEWLRRPKFLTELFKKTQPPQQPPVSPEIPLVFVEVNPAQAVAEPPKETQFYSDKNSTAANPDAERETGLPKISGTQEQMIKTEDVPRELFKPLQPSPPVAVSPPQPQPPEPPQEEQKPKPTMSPGDLAMARPDPKPIKSDGQAEQPRARTIKEALARKKLSMRPGEKMKQEGGVRALRPGASFDVKATSFGEYDSAFIDAIAYRWYSLLDKREYASDSRGKVRLQFILHQDGRISDMNVAENTAGEMLSLICMMAVQQSAPFMPWPIEMRRVLGESRRIQFTFYYN
jgi:hypothetical protein